MPATHGDRSIIATPVAPMGRSYAIPVFVTASRHPPTP